MRDAERSLFDTRYPSAEEKTPLNRCPVTFLRYGFLHHPNSREVRYVLVSVRALRFCGKYGVEALDRRDPGLLETN